MKALAKIFFYIVITCVTISVTAGTRDAYFVLVVDLDDGKSKISKRLVEDYFYGRYPDHVYDCTVNSGGRFELAYLRSRPKSITNSLINSALSGNHQGLRKVQKALGNYKDDELKDGFDFLLAYRATNERIELSAVSAAVGQISIRRNVAIHLDSESMQTQMAVAAAICELSGAMPFVAAP